MVSNFYHRLYNINSWCQSDVPNILRCADEWPAVCYAHDIFDKSSDADSLHQQIQYLTTHRVRKPHHVLEIGSGRGEISCTLSHIGYRVTTVDVNNNSERFHRIFAQKHFGCETDDSHTLMIGDLDLATRHLDLATVDTIILVESIEHIMADEWWRFFDFMLPCMKRNNTQLIATNLPDYWPLGLPGDCFEHVSLIDDVFYDRLADECNTVLYRKTSHIALRY